MSARVTVPQSPLRAWICCPATFAIDRSVG